MTQTIVALATPPGRSGVAVVRVSGPKALESLRMLVPSTIALPARQAIHATLRDPKTKSLIDRALVLAFEAPASFTGEHVAEYQIHGSPAIIEELISYFCALPDHRMAEPGEFTRRAFENGKLDLTEAEAIADLINAETSLQKEAALRQMSGGLSALYNSWAESLKTILAHVEADLEFPDEDLPEGLWPQLVPQIESLKDKIAAHLNDNRRGERLRDGIKVAIVGAPNAGKSSLLNHLAQREVAIVSDQAGTTRDVLEVHLNLSGLPIILQDTAGLRPEQLSQQGQDLIEAEGIKRALKAAQEAELVLLVLDSSADKDHEATLALADKRSILVYSKCDLNEGSLPAEGILLSLRSGDGIDQLLKAIEGRAKDLIGTQEAPSITRQRHRDLIAETLGSLERALQAPMPELSAEDLRLAIRSLGRITGRVDVEDLLDVIFHDFCIGK